MSEKKRPSGRSPQAWVGHIAIEDRPATEEQLRAWREFWAERYACCARKTPSKKADADQG